MAGLMRRSLLHAIAAASAARPSIRIHTPGQQPLVAGASFELTDGQRHHLFNVMRQREGNAVAVFNGFDGEWEAEITSLNKRNGVLHVRTQIRPQPVVVGAPTLLFGVLKGARQPMLIEKAVELGVGDLQPVLSQHCAARSLNVDRLNSIAAEVVPSS